MQNLGRVAPADVEKLMTRQREICQNCSASPTLFHLSPREAGTTSITKRLWSICFREHPAPTHVQSTQFSHPHPSSQVDLSLRVFAMTLRGAV
ncbi:unnamed protein product [Prunus brigantina]